MDDFAVIDFEGTIEGRPISEIAPEASKNLHGGKNSGCEWGRKIFCRIFANN